MLHIGIKFGQDTSLERNIQFILEYLIENASPLPSKKPFLLLLSPSPFTTSPIITSPQMLILKPSFWNRHSWKEWEERSDSALQAAVQLALFLFLLDHKNLAIKVETSNMARVRLKVRKEKKTIIFFYLITFLGFYLFVCLFSVKNCGWINPTFEVNLLILAR